MTLDRAEALHQLKFLFDQVHQTAERIEHLPAAMPLHVHPQSLNYPDDLHRLEGEYKRLFREGIAQGLFTPADVEAEGLPAEFGRQADTSG